MTDLTRWVIEKTIPILDGNSEVITDSVNEDQLAMSQIKTWIANEYRILVNAEPMIDPKYNNRILWSISLIEWSRSHEFWLDKSSVGNYHDSTEKALGYGLLQALEIIQIKLKDGRSFK